MLPTIAAAVQAEELRGCGGRGGCGGGGTAVAVAEGAKDEYLPAGSRGCQQPGAGRGQGA